MYEIDWKAWAAIAASVAAAASIWNLIRAERTQRNERNYEAWLAAKLLELRAKVNKDPLGIEVEPGRYSFRYGIGWVDLKDEEVVHAARAVREGFMVWMRPGYSVRISKPADQD